MAGRRPIWLVFLLVLAVVSVAIPVVVILNNPQSSLDFLLLLPGLGVCAVCTLVFFDVFYIEESERPSFIQRKMVHRCPYCGHWSARWVNVRLVGDEETSTRRGGGGSVTADGTFGTRAPGIDGPFEKRETTTENLEFSRDMRCSHCGKTWARTLTQSQPALPREDDRNVPELMEPGEGEG